MPAMHEVDYKVFGRTCSSSRSSLIRARRRSRKRAAMFYMEDGITMETYSATARDSKRLSWMHCSGQGNGC